jgi:serine/threonine protein kinase
MAVFKVNEMYAGRYLLEKLVGEGGFSEVWKAKDTMADEATVAIKIYAPEKGLEDFGIKQFRKEYSITHHLSHPHLIKVFHFDISDRSPYLIMPYYKLGSLSNLLYEQGTLDEKQIALFMFQVGGALEELHLQEPIILHQDIKPDNILIQEYDHFILTDFGISSQTRHTLSKSTGSFKSLTIAYAPPERFDKNPASNEASDVFSLGVTLYETCTGHVPWEGNGGQSLLKGAQVPELPPKFPRELNRMIQSCMCLDSSERPSAGKIKSWGKFYLDNAYWKYSDEEKPKTPPLKKIIFASLSILLLLSVAGFLYYKSSGSKDPIAEKRDTASATMVAVIPPQQPSNSDSLGNSMQDTNAIVTKASPAMDPVPSSSGKATQAQAVDPRVIPVADPESPVSYAQPAELVEYLNQISNPKIPRKIRKEWKKQVLAFFDTGPVLVLDKKESLSKRYELMEFLNLLLDIPHSVKVIEVFNNGEEKIKELQIQMTLI